MSQRTERIDELLRQEIGQLLAREVADPGVGFVTITEVETSSDLRHARLWVSVIGQPQARRASILALERAMPFVRRELGRRLRIRRIPEFTVKLDESIERGTRVMHLLSELEAGAIPDELPAGESLPTPTARLPQQGEPEPEPIGTPAPPEHGRPSAGPGHGSGRHRGKGPGVTDRNSAGARRDPGSDPRGRGGSSGSDPRGRGGSSGRRPPAAKPGQRPGGGRRRPGSSGGEA